MADVCFPNFQNFGLFNSDWILSEISRRCVSVIADKNIENDCSDADNNLWYFSSRSSSVVVLKINKTLSINWSEVTDVQMKTVDLLFIVYISEMVWLHCCVGF